MRSINYEYLLLKKRKKTPKQTKKTRTKAKILRRERVNGF